MRFNGLDNLET